MSISSDASAATDAELVALLKDPEIREALATLAANAPQLALVSSMVSGLLERAPDITANINGTVQTLREGSLKDTDLGKIAELGPAVSDAAPTIKGFLESPVLKPEVVQVIGTLGESAQVANERTRGKQATVGGLLAISKQLKDPHVQETLAFLFEFAKVFGERQASGTRINPGA